jgi:YHS domain-containing protein
MTKDPVCGMEIDELKAKGNSEYEGTTFYFCSASCKAAFDKEPATFVAGSPYDSKHDRPQE